MIRISDLSKSFTLHNQGSAVIPVMAGATLSVAPGECVGLIGNSGAGKSTLMRMVWGNYLAASGAILVGTVDVASAAPRDIIRLRRETLGYVSQFLRVVPRVNSARGFAHPYPALLLDEPTASLDATNREVVLGLIEEAKARGAAILGIFHDEAARERVCDRLVDVRAFTPKVA